MIDRRSIDVRIKNMLERYENIVQAKKPYAFEMEVMYSDSLQFTPVITRRENTALSLDYLKSRITEALKNKDVQAFRVRKANGVNGKSLAETWEEYIMRDDLQFPLTQQIPQTQNNSLGFVEINGEQIPFAGLGSYFENQLKEKSSDLEKERQKLLYEQEKMREFQDLKMQIFELQQNNLNFKLTVEKQISTIKELEESIEELEEEIEELEEQLSEIPKLRQKTSATDVAIKTVATTVAKYAEKNGKVNNMLGNILNLFEDDNDDSETPPPPPPPPVQENTGTDEKNKSISNIVKWLNSLDELSFKKVYNINSKMYTKPELIDEFLQTE
ncbi:MAG: hypothetical protein SNJ71_00305 [Bacteroidales bacterium]